MTIEKGAEWGRVVTAPDGLVLAAGDSEVVQAIGRGDAVAPTAGDLHRTVGGRDVRHVTEVNELPIDLLDVTLDDGVAHLACAHVAVRRPWYLGGWWLGTVLMVMNAQFLRGWHVVARGHPNDGRAESCGWGRDLAVRPRIAARRRLRTGAHVPHPAIETRSFRERAWTFERPLVVRVDGVRVGRSRSLHVVVRPDAATVYA